MPGQIVHRILYPFKSVKDQWEHTPAGGANWERVLNEDTANYEAGTRNVPNVTHNLHSKAGSNKEDNVQLGKGGAIWIPAPFEVVKSITAWFYVSEAVVKSAKFRLTIGELTGAELSGELELPNTGAKWESITLSLTEGVPEGLSRYEKFLKRTMVCGVTTTTKECIWNAAYVDAEVELWPTPPTLFVGQSIQRGAVI